MKKIIVIMLVILMAMMVYAANDRVIDEKFFGLHLTKKMLDQKRLRKFIEKTPEGSDIRKDVANIPAGTTFPLILGFDSIPGTDEVPIWYRIFYKSGDRYLYQPYDESGMRTGRVDGGKGKNYLNKLVIPWPKNEYTSEDSFIHDSEGNNYSFGVWRLWDIGIYWPSIQPNSSDDFNTDVLDLALELADEHGVDLILNLSVSPDWAASNPDAVSPYGNGSGSPPKTDEIWIQYVSKMGNYLKEKLSPEYFEKHNVYWEVWNEPDFPIKPKFYDGSIARLAELTKLAYITLKGIDKENYYIVTPPVTGYIALLGPLDAYFRNLSYIADGDNYYFDYIGTHFYCWFDWHRPIRIKALVKQINTTLDNYNIPRKEIWNTECGIENSNKKDPRLVRGFMCRMAITHWYYGVTSIIPYTWHNTHIIDMINIDEKRASGSMMDGYNITVNSAGVAYEITQDWLIGAKIVSLEHKPSNIRITTLDRDGEISYVLWHTQDTNPDRKVNFTIPADWNVTKMHDLSGNTTDITGQKTVSAMVEPILLTK